MFASGLGGQQLETRNPLFLVDPQKNFVDTAGKLFVLNTGNFYPSSPALVNDF
jgi:hypothetical protein